MAIKTKQSNSIQVTQKPTSLKCKKSQLTTATKSK